jgi:acyl transferase domain-containing protein/phosphopantetheinyl transferase
MQNLDKDIAIVGISTYCPAGESIEEVWAGLARGGDFITDVPPEIMDARYFDGIGKEPDRFYCKRGGFTRKFKTDPMRYGLLPVTVDGVDPDQLLALSGTEHALIDAGVFEKGISLQNCSIIIGKGNFAGLIAMRCVDVIHTALQLTDLLKIALPQLTEEDLDRVKKAYQAEQGRFLPDMVIGMMPSLIASLVANRFDMHGPAYTVDGACASGVLAINHSIDLLRRGQCDVAVAGGMHTSQSAVFWSAFNLMGAMSHKEKITPFSADADGLLIGHGGGFLVLKTLRQALEHGDRIYALIKETAICSDGAGTHVTVTSVKGQVRVLDMAWSKAKMDPNIIGHVEAHGTATPVGDRTEAATLKEFFGDNTKPMAYVGSIKSNIGHTMAGAGMMGIIKTALSLYHRKIVPTLHCENPLPALLESRFRPPQELTDWDGEQLPLIAGVNAFGFGGINSHAIMTVYEPERGAPPQPKPKAWFGEAVRVSAPDRETLIEKLEIGDYTHSGGDYRIIIFDPDENRIKQAISIVEKDVPWRGKIDIWFSNRPLLTEDAKIAFLVPGANLDDIAESDSLSEYFELSSLGEIVESMQSGVESGTMSKLDQEMTTHNMQAYGVESLCVSGLEKVGITPDLYAGHSFGEWNALAFSGMTDANMRVFFESMPPASEQTAFPLIAVSGCDRSMVEVWCEQIPGIYVANDNCPSQILLTGDEAPMEELIALLKEKQIYHTSLPFGAGYHTPMVKDKIGVAQKVNKGIELKKGEVPVWSAMTLEEVPLDREEYNDYSARYLMSTVRFRELIEKLYHEQNVRAFVQIGRGNLVGYVEDTLKGLDFGAVSSCSPTLRSADQLRRVLALLFTEGRDVDANFLGVKPLYRVERRMHILPMAMPMIKDLPELREVVSERYGAAGSGAFGGLQAETGSPIVDTANDNMREAMQVQNEIVKLFEQNRSRMPAAMGIAAQAGGAAAAVATGTAGRATVSSRTRSGGAKVVDISNAAQAQTPTPENFEEPMHLTYEEHPYLVDHTIIRQPDDWPFAEDMNPVVPFTMTIELLAEIALKHAPGRKLVRIKKLVAFRWIALEDPFDGIVRGVWKEPNCLELELVGHAKGEFEFADEWPLPPEEYMGDIDIGEVILPDPDISALYDEYSFHGPQYRSTMKVDGICARGMATSAKKVIGKGSLLDVMGQQIGLFIHITQKENTISFPVRLKELTFYNDLFDQEGEFKHTLIVKRMTDTSIIADMVLKRGGKIWSVAREFVNHRFEGGKGLWDLVQKPWRNVLAWEIAPDIHFYVNHDRSNLMNFLEQRYLLRVEKNRYQSIESPQQQRDFLIGRIALKDAVRKRVAQDPHALPFPIEIICEYDENGKLFVRGHGRLKEAVEGLHVSLGHKDSMAIAAVTKRPVGVDVERIDEKDEGFLELAFTKEERELLKSMDRAEGPIRFWVAKESCAKKTGLGLQGNPKRFEVSAVDGDILTVNGEKVMTAKVEDEEYIIGWTME